MAEPQPAPTDVPLLKGAFGALQAAAQAHKDTSEVWQDLRSTVGSWALSTQGVRAPYDPAEADSLGRQILSAQGIRGDTVSTFRGVAGQWLGAKESLHAVEPTAQITGSEIFTPPWSTSSSPLVPSRYAFRTQWQFETGDGGVASVWRYDEVTAPLTTVNDLLAEVQSRPPPTSPPIWQLAAAPPVLTDYHLEQI